MGSRSLKTAAQRRRAPVEVGRGKDIQPGIGDGGPQSSSADVDRSPASGLGFLRRRCAIARQYKSVSLLRIDRARATSIEAYVTSPSVADRVLSKYEGSGNSPESRAAFLSQHLRIIDTQHLGESPGERLFRLDVTHADPKIAQSIASDLIDVWLESTRPQGSERASLEAELERNELAADVNSKLIDELQSKATKLPAPSSSVAELAAKISNLVTRRDQKSVGDKCDQ